MLESQFLAIPALSAPQDAHAHAPAATQPFFLLRRLVAQELPATVLAIGLGLNGTATATLVLQTTPNVLTIAPGTLVPLANPSLADLWRPKAKVSLAPSSRPPVDTELLFQLYTQRDPGSTWTNTGLFNFHYVTPATVPHDQIQEEKGSSQLIPFEILKQSFIWVCSVVRGQFLEPASISAAIDFLDLDTVFTPTAP